jgi:dTDP-4-amino-4,6-dideoxygalactose transaminase
MKGNTFNEIGGNFWLKPDQIGRHSEIFPEIVFVENQKDLFYTSSGRGAISLALNQKAIKGRKALLPVFTCESVIKPFIDCGFEPYFYEIEKDLTLSYEKLNKMIKTIHPSVLFLQSYFGFNTLLEIRNFLPQLKEEHDLVIIEDITHSWLSCYKKSGADYYVVSLRKWLELPDGGLLISTNETIDTAHVINAEDSLVVDLFSRASALKHEYTQTLNPEIKPEFRKLFYRIEEILDNQTGIKKISSVSKYILTDSDFESIKRKRRENYLTLLKITSLTSLCRPVFNNQPEDVVPLYFTVFIDSHREVIQKQFAEQNIYAPVLWPVPDCLSRHDLLKSNNLYEKLLCIPCDQRYSPEDMKRIRLLFPKFFF